MNLGGRLPMQQLTNQLISKILQNSTILSFFGIDKTYQTGEETPLAHDILTLILSNQFLVTGIVLGLGGLIYMFFLTRILIPIWYWIRALFILTVSIEKRDHDVYTWALSWLSAQPGAKASKNIQLLDQKGRVDHHYRRSPTLKKKTEENILVVPKGSNVLWYRRCLVWFSRVETKGPQGMWPGAQNTETVTFHFVGWINKETFLQRLLKEGRAIHEKSTKGKTLIFSSRNGYDPTWSKSGQKSIRKLDSVVLPGGIKENILDDVSEFIKDRQWYEKVGVPYKRGYLLYGPPGTGKTSFILAIAGQLNHNVCVVNLSTHGLNDTTLNTLFNSTPEKSILVIEDIDCVFVKRKQTQPNFREQNGPGISFSGILNAIDGIGSQEGRIIFLTTNHIDRLSSALIRPGRVDKKVQFDFATSYQIEHMLKRFFDHKDIDKSIVEYVVQRLSKEKITTAQLQGFFMKNRKNGKSLDKKVPEFLRECEDDRLKNRKEAEEKKAEEKKIEEINLDRKLPSRVPGPRTGKYKS